MYYNDDVIEYFIKKDTPQKFWDVFNRCERPMIYYREEGGLIPLYEYNSNTAIKICQMSYNSPIQHITKGIVDTISDLTIKSAQYKHQEEEHVAHQIANIADGYTSIVRAYQVINDPRTPEGVRRYASDALERLLDKQSKLNDNLDIRIDRIDKRI